MQYSPYFCTVKNYRMGLNRIMRRLIIGEDQFIQSYSEFKGVMLSGQFAIIGILTCVVMGSVEFFFGNFLPIAVFGLGIIALSISLHLHRIGRHCRANYFLLTPVSVLAFLMASSESPATGAFIHFVPISLGAFILFGYRNRRASVLYTLMAFILFMLAYVFDFSVLPFRYYDESQLLFTRITNFSTALLASCMAVFLLIRLNNKNSVQLLESNRMLSKTNAELDRFVYSTSHDLRAPLTSILGLINISSLTDDVNAHKRYLGMMKDRINILDKFIKDITDYSRNNRLAVDIQKVKLSSLVTEIWEMLQYTPEAQNVNFHVEIPTDVLVETDVSRLRTVLLNLVSNALRYHDQSKQEKYIRMRYQVNGKGFHIKVEDNGQGIDPAYHHRIFDMFFRASETSSGSGLGLYIVKETIAKLSGTIQLESALGIGTTFTVKLPYA